MVIAAVPFNGGMINLVNGEIKKNTNTKTIVTDIGPACYNVGSVDSTVVLPFTNFGQTTANFLTAGLLFKCGNGLSQNMMTFNDPTGNTRMYCLTGPPNKFVYDIAAGNVFNGPVISNHSYLFLCNNALGTANVNRTCILYDITDGTSIVGVTASSGNVIFGSTIDLVAENTSTSNPGTNGIAGAFLSLSVNIPPAVTDPPTFNPLGVMLASLSDPWSLWYA